MNDMKRKVAEWRRIMDAHRQAGIKHVAVEDNPLLHDPDFLNFARLLEAGKVAIPHDDELWAELLAIEYTDESGRTKMEKKSELAARLGRSPDKADAVTMAFDGLGGPPRKIQFLTGISV